MSKRKKTNEPKKTNVTPLNAVKPPLWGLESESLRQEMLDIQVKLTLYQMRFLLHVKEFGPHVPLWERPIEGMNDGYHLYYAPIILTERDAIELAQKKTLEAMGLVTMVQFDKDTEACRWQLTARGQIVTDYCLQQLEIYTYMLQTTSSD
jgi:hypothetical protein